MDLKGNYYPKATGLTDKEMSIWLECLYEGETSFTSKMYWRVAYSVYRSRTQLLMHVRICKIWIEKKNTTKKKGLSETRILLPICRIWLPDNKMRWGNKIGANKALLYFNFRQSENSQVNVDCAVIHTTDHVITNLAGNIQLVQ